MGKGFEDHKYSYIVIRKGERPENGEDATLESRSFHWPRMIRRPLKRGGHAIIDVCDLDSALHVDSQIHI